MCVIVVYQHIGLEKLSKSLQKFVNVFARHHTNPVGTEWKWKMDDAETIFQGALKNHTNMIRQFKGMSRTIGKNVYVYIQTSWVPVQGKIISVCDVFEINTIILLESV